MTVTAISKLITGRGIVIRTLDVLFIGSRYQNTIYIGVKVKQCGKKLFIRIIK